MTLLCWLGAALLPLATARGILPRQDTTTINEFGIIAIHSGSPIHLSSVNAADNKFWIGRDTETFCPNVTGLVCPTDVYTQFAASSDSDSLILVRLVCPQINTSADWSLGCDSPWRSTGLRHN